MPGLRVAGAVHAKLEVRPVRALPDDLQGPEVQRALYDTIT